MAIQNIIKNIVLNMDANTDSFDFTFETDSWKNLNLDEQPLPSVHLMMPLRGKPKMQKAGSFDYEYTCILSFMYASELDDDPEAHELNLTKAENALSQFILMLQKDTDNVDSSKTVFGDFMQFTAHQMYDRCVDGVTIEIKVTPKQRPAACVPSYSVPVGDCDPVLIKNSDESYLVYKPSGEMLTLPDISFTDSNGIVTQVPAVTDIVATPAVPCSGIGGYKGSHPYYTLPSNNACGHAFRFCGRTGGYCDDAGNYFDKNGVATTKALAFPNGIIYDTNGVTCDGDLLVLQDQFLLTGLVTLAGAIAFCESFSLGGFNDWTQMTRDNYDQIRNNNTTYVLDQPPFSNPYTAVELWLNTTFFFAGTDTRAWKLSVYGGEDFVFKAAEAARAFPVRIGNISEFQL